MGLDISLQKHVFSTKIGPIKVDGHVYKITDLDNTYFSMYVLTGLHKEIVHAYVVTSYCIT